MAVSKRIFGSDVDQLTKSKIAQYQLEAQGNTDILDSLAASSTGTMDINQNFDGAGGLSSRTPFARMWTGIDVRARKVNPKYKSFTHDRFKKMKEQGRLSSDGDEYYLNESLQKRCYTIGTNNVSMLGKDINASFLPEDNETDGNEHFAVQPGITSVSSNSQGPLGLIRKTTVNFIVHNHHDFDEIYSKYFLRPGALLFVDFGWDALNEPLYDPNDLVFKKIQELGLDLESILYEDGGIVDIYKGDLETIVGYVTNFSSTLNENGYYDCSVTITSKNAALIGSDTSERKEKEDMIKSLDTELINFAMKLFELKESVDVFGYNIGEKPSFVAGNKSYSTSNIEDYNEYARLQAAQQLSYSFSGPQISIRTESSMTGVYFYSDDKYDQVTPAGSDKVFVMLGLLEDLFLNDALALGSKEDIISNSSKNFTAKFNSRNSYCRYDTNLKKAQKNGKYSGTIPVFLYPNDWGISYNSLVNKVPDLVLDKKGKFLKNSEITDPQVKQKYRNDINSYGKLYADNIDRARNRIPVRELFVNLQVVKNAFLQNDSVEVALKEVLDAINRDSHEILNLSLHVINKAESEMCIIDRNKIAITNPDDNLSTNNVYNNMLMFSPGSESSIIQSFNLSMDTPKNGLQNMIAIQSSNPEKKVFPYSSNLNEQLNMYLLNLDMQNSQIGFAYIPESDDYDIERIEDANDGMIQLGSVSANHFIFDKDASEVKEELSALNLANFDSDTYSINAKIKNANEKALSKAQNIPDDEESEEQNAEFLDDFEYGPDYKVVSSLREYFRFLATQSYFSSEEASQIIPLKLSLTLYGISGLQTGDLFRVDYLPKRYVNLVYFQITKVNHRINSSGWSTELESVMRVRPRPKALYKKSEPSNTTDMYKIADTTNIILAKSIFGNFGLTINDKVLKGSTVSSQGFVNSISYLKYEGVGVPGLVGESKKWNYTFSFTANCSDKYLLCKPVQVKKDGTDNWSKIGRFGSDPAADYFNKNGTKYDFNWFYNGKDNSSVDTNISTVLGITGTNDGIFGAGVGDKTNTKGPAAFKAGKFTGNRTHFYMYPWQNTTKEIFKGGAAFSWLKIHTGVVIYPDKEYYILINKHDFLVVPKELPTKYLKRINYAYDPDGNF